MKWSCRASALVAFFGLITFFLGCHRNPTSTTPAAPLSPPQGVSPGGPGAQGAFDAESGPHSDGKKAMVANGCFRCHAINGLRGPVGGSPMAGGPAGPMAGGPQGPGGPGGGPGQGMGRGGARAPDLGHVAKNAEHTVDWLTKLILDPKSVKPDAKMPPYEGKIKDDDLRAVAEYLASLK
jgi:hypothetical protein